MPSTTSSQRTGSVPIRTIAATIGMVLATAVLLLLVWKVHRVLAWVVVAGLLALILGPAVDLVERRLHLRRALATLAVFVVVVLAIAGLLTVFIRPLVTEGQQFAQQAPTYVEQARSGRGPVGGLIRRYHIDQYVQRNQAKLRAVGSQVTAPALGVLASIFSTIVALATIFVLTYLLVLQGPALLVSALNALPERRRDRVRRVAADCSKAVTGYMTGNLLISIIAGVLTYIVLWIMGVPYKGVVSLFVGFADLIPLVGATLGAVVATLVAALHSLPAAIVVIIFFVVYQQLENHLLQPVIMSRTVALSPLVVLVSILVGVELLGFLGALLAIPVAGVLHVITRDLWDNYEGRPKPEPTIGTDQIPVSHPDAPDQPSTSGSDQQGRTTTSPPS
jgi:predicted PurR-regulated permease PerM